MEPIPNIERLPALPPHLNPYCPPKAIGRRFNVNYGPSPLRQSYIPGEAPNVAGYPRHAGTRLCETGSRSSYDQQCSNSQATYATPYAQSSPMDTTALGPPPGLEHVARSRFPEYVQECIDKFHKSVNMAFDWANRGKLTSESKRTMLEHMNLCLKTIKYYVKDIEAQLESSGSYVAASQLQVLEVERRGLKELRRLVEELSTR